MVNTTVVHHLTRSLDGSKLLGFIFLAFLVFLTVFGNILVILAILRTSRLRTSSNVLIINMACGDILYSVSTLPLSMVLLCFRETDWPLGKIGNIIFDATWFSFLVLSFINVVAIALERYIAITKPYMYKTLVTKRRVILLCFALWIYDAILIFAVTFTFRKPNGITYLFLIPGLPYYAVFIFHSSLAFIFVPFLYAKIFFVARKHNIEMVKQDFKSRRCFYLQMKATWTIGFIILLFFLVWLPFIIKQFLGFEAIYYRGQWDFANSITCYLTYCNGPVNILVYSCRNRDIRRAILKILPSAKCSSMNVAMRTNCSPDI